ncbi:MAG: hypothetical protein ABJF23_23000 [Bryobacteraceae bacterium]
METVTVKSSTIFISTGKRTKIYRSVADVPPRLRKRLEQSTSGMNSATILIADRNGREELVRSIQGLPSGVQTRVGANRKPKAKPAQPAAAIWHDYRHWIELAAIGVLGLAIWLVFLR